jgi:probable addiction module antidote protein
MPKRTTSFRDDFLADLADPQEAVYYLNAALEDSNELFLVALRDVAESRQIARVAEQAGVARESIYRMLDAKGNPTYVSLNGILHALGLKLAVKPENRLAPRRYRDDTYRAGIFKEQENDTGQQPQPPASATKRKDVGTAGSMNSNFDYCQATASR